MNPTLGRFVPLKTPVIDDNSDDSGNSAQWRFARVSIISTSAPSSSYETISHWQGMIRHMQFVTKGRIFAALLVFSCSASLAHGEEVLLRGEVQPSGFQRLKQKVDIAGHLNLDPHGKGVTKVPLVVTANVDFHQRVLSESLRVRHYQVAAAKFQFGTEENAQLQTPTVRDSRRTVCLTSTGEHDAYYCPTGALTREELELLDTPTCRVDLVELLPGRKVAVDDTWKHDSTTLARLLNLDTIGVNQATSRLASVKGRKATITLEGNVDGAVGGVATEIEINAKYVFDLDRKRVTSMAMAYREKRAIAAAEPGFEVVVKLAMAEAPLATSAELSDDRLANLTLRNADRSTWVEYESKHGGYQLLHDSRWRVLLDQPKTTIFRYVDGGELIAQANLARLHADQTEASITMEAFAEQAGKALGDNLGQLIESKQYESPAGYRVLRVEATGVISDVAMRWVYYHVNNNEGLRASAVITVEEKLLDRLAGADKLLIEALKLVPLAESKGEPTPAKTAARPQE
jgi:hypothetical protein